MPHDLLDNPAQPRVLTLGPWRLWTHVGLARELALHPPDALFIPAHVLPLPQAVRHTTRAVVTVHDVGYRYFPNTHPLRQRLYLDWSTALIVRYAWRVVVDSEATRGDVQRFYHAAAGKLHVAYPGPPALASTSSQDEIAIQHKMDLFGKPYALYIGTLQPRKNLARLIEAWQILLKDWGGEVNATNCSEHTVSQGASSQSQDIAAPSQVSQLQFPVLVIAGDQGWGHENLPAEVHRRGLSSHVRFTGYINDAEKAALLRGARAFAYCSLHEGFGLPILEAQSAGVPVVCSNTSSLPEVAGDAALMVDPLDPRAIASALRRALCDEATRASLSQAGYRNVARFSWQHCAQVILELLENT